MKRKEKTPGHRRTTNVRGGGVEAVTECAPAAPVKKMFFPWSTTISNTLLCSSFSGASRLSHSPESHVTGHIGEKYLPMVCCFIRLLELLEDSCPFEDESDLGMAERASGMQGVNVKGGERDRTRWETRSCKRGSDHSCRRKRPVYWKAERRANGGSRLLKANRRGESRRRLPRG